MTKKEKIEAYVKDVFERYAINKYGFFFVFEEETGERIDIPLFPCNKVDDETLERVSKHLGITKEEMISMDEEAAKRYWNKYPFFYYYQKFMYNWAWQSRYKSECPSAEELFLRRLFETEDELLVEDRYDYPAVKSRMIQKLKEIDQVMPGTYHEHAEITQLSISTEVFVSFPQCKEMLASFIDMINRLKELFFKAIQSDLNSIEINEFNFLTSWLRMCDVLIPQDILTYDKVCLYRDVYSAEGYKDFFAYVRFNNFIDTEPWRCREFFNDLELVQEFVNIFPQAKKKMRQFALDVAKFSCSFVWSDAKPIMFLQEEEKELSNFNALIGEKDVPLEERAKERTYIYVEKNSDEMFDWMEYVQKLKDATSPPSKGGLKLPTRETYTTLGTEESIIRIQARMAVKHGGNK